MRHEKGYVTMSALIFADEIRPGMLVRHIGPHEDDEQQLTFLVEKVRPYPPNSKRPSLFILLGRDEQDCPTRIQVDNLEGFEVLNDENESATGRSSDLVDYEPGLRTEGASLSEPIGNLPGPLADPVTDDSRKIEEVQLQLGRLMFPSPSTDVEETDEWPPF
jgi:hypothetical protein